MASEESEAALVLWVWYLVEDGVINMDVARVIEERIKKTMRYAVRDALAAARERLEKEYKELQAEHESWEDDYFDLKEDAADLWQKWLLLGALSREMGDRAARLGRKLARVRRAHMDAVPPAAAHKAIGKNN